MIPLDETRTLLTQLRVKGVTDHLIGKHGMPAAEAADVALCIVRWLEDEDVITPPCVTPAIRWEVETP